MVLSQVNNPVTVKEQKFVLLENVSIKSARENPSYLMMLTSQPNCSSSLHLKQRPLPNLAPGLLRNKLAIRVSQLLGFVSLLVTCVAFVLPELFGVFSDIVAELFVDGSQLRVCCIGGRVRCGLCVRFDRHAERRKHQRLDGADDRVAKVRDKDGEEDEEDENLSSREQCDELVIPGEEGVAVAQAASGSQQHCDGHQHKRNTHAFIGGQGGQHGGNDRNS